MLATSASVSTLGLLAGLPGTSLSWLQTVETLTTPSLLLLKVGRSFPNNPFPILQVPHYLIGPRVYFVAIETEWTHVAANLDVGGDDIINIIAVKREDAVSETGNLLIDNVQVRIEINQQHLPVFIMYILQNWNVLFVLNSFLVKNVSSIDIWPIRCCTTESWEHL